jgi:hypothetical protein
MDNVTIEHIIQVLDLTGTAIIALAAIFVLYKLQEDE